MDPQSEVLQEPVSVDVTQAVRARFRDHGISTAWSIADYDEDRGWLASVSTYAFGHRFRIEGPCAFYGGPYGPNAWTGDGGLCAMGAASYSHSPLPEGMVVGRYCSIGKGLAYYYGQVRKKEKKFYILCQDYLFGHDLADAFKQGLKEYYPTAQIVGEDYHNIPPYYWYNNASFVGPTITIPAAKVLPLMDQKLDRCRGKSEVIDKSPDARGRNLV